MFSTVSKEYVFYLFIFISRKLLVKSTRSLHLLSIKLYSLLYAIAFQIIFRGLFKNVFTHLIKVSVSLIFFIQLALVDDKINDVH